MIALTYSTLSTAKTEREPNTHIAVPEPVIAKTQWLHGSPNCANNLDPAFDIYKHDSQSYILRQNKCLTFEAPFIYVLIGSNQIFVLDTGALDSPEHSLRTQLEGLIGLEQTTSKEWIIAHSHGHKDHYKGDAYFDNKPNTTLVPTTETAVKAYFKLEAWPKSVAEIDLGNRKLSIIPTPGHHNQGITIYDHQTQWLLTGDTLYPGYIYVKDWKDYRASINRLANFSKQHPISALLGAHIEMMDQAGTYYPIGTSYQPEEARLELSTAHLLELNERLKTAAKAQEIQFDNFIIKPMSGFQKALSRLVGWIVQ
ncbi:MBL fold metallo-hydrolase [Simiduia curdlanivorans]|uniref:MBL fold metallo-hydrolase n=1 Tax=Simiduia curdlanivorans TaxID=1492769 RepID=A0ABV8V126_9GAMM